MKVLVVEDNLLLGSLLKMIQQDEGHETQFAGNGVDGYASYLRFRPEVVITDLHMPKANGVEFLDAYAPERLAKIYLNRFGFNKSCMYVRMAL